MKSLARRASGVKVCLDVLVGEESTWCWTLTSWWRLDGSRHAPLAWASGCETADLNPDLSTWHQQMPILLTWLFCTSHSEAQSHQCRWISSWVSRSHLGSPKNVATVLSRWSDTRTVGWSHVCRVELTWVRASQTHCRTLMSIWCHMFCLHDASAHLKSTRTSTS